MEEHRRILAVFGSEAVGYRHTYRRSRFAVVCRRSAHRSSGICLSGVVEQMVSPDLGISEVASHPFPYYRSLAAIAEAPHRPRRWHRSHLFSSGFAASHVSNDGEEPIRNHRNLVSCFLALVAPEMGGDPVVRTKTASAVLYYFDADCQRPR